MIFSFSLKKNAYFRVPKLKRMRPDYPSKIFIDERASYILLMQALAEDAVTVFSSIV
jgi:hypothetical protein